MGETSSRLRDATERELDALTGHSDWYQFPMDDLSGVRGLEYDVAIDGVVKYPRTDLREDYQLNVLSVGSVMIGFEASFMAPAIVSGVFPTDHLRIAFAVRPSSEGKGRWEDATEARWAVAFHWDGNPLQVEDMAPDADCPSMDHVLPAYRLRAMQQAVAVCQSPE